MPSIQEALCGTPGAAARYKLLRLVVCRPGGNVSATFITSFTAHGPGLRVAVKDLIDMAGVPTTAGSRVVADAPVPAPVAPARLAGPRAPGPPMAGQTHLPHPAARGAALNPRF